MGGVHAKPKAGLGTSRKKSTITAASVLDDDSTEMSDLNSDSDRDGKGNGSGEESGEGMGEASDDDLDRAKLPEKDAKRVLNDEVIILFTYFFLLNCLVHFSYPKIFPLSSMTM